MQCVHGSGTCYVVCLFVTLLLIHETHHVCREADTEFQKCRTQCKLPCGMCQVEVAQIKPGIRAERQNPTRPSCHRFIVRVITLRVARCVRAHRIPHCSSKPPPVAACDVLHDALKRMRSAPARSGQRQDVTVQVGDWEFSSTSFFACVHWRRYHSAVGRRWCVAARGRPDERPGRQVVNHNVFRFKAY